MKEGLIREICVERSDFASATIEMGNLPIVVKVWRNGQEPPWKSDRVQILLRVELPAITDFNGSRLIPDLVYGDRAGLMGKVMINSWGEPATKIRYCEAIYSGQTWREALTAGLDKLWNEFDKLRDEVAKRRLALEKAEG